MKKIFLCLILCSLFLTGCGRKSEKVVLEEFHDKVMNSEAYYLSGDMELVNNEDVYNYSVMVSYKKDDYYKIELTNVINDHKQIILRNEEGVYVVTPSLNKSFKFQSDWPYNNSQVYLLSSLLDDISNDGDRTFEVIDNEYVFTTSVNYPNNPKLVNQKVYFGDDYLPTKVMVLDNDGNTHIRMEFDKIDLRVNFNDTYFDLNSIIDTNNLNSEEDDKNDNLTQEPSDNNVKETATLEDVIYPMYLPVNTYLTNQEKVSTEDGERLILTFTGDKPFTLMEETVSYNAVAEIIPTYGDVELIGNSLAVVNENSVNWFDGGVEYYVVSDVMNTTELLDVVRSISVLPVSK